MLTGPPLIADITSCPVPPAHCALWWLGQHSFVAKLGHSILYLDPFLSNLDSRQIPPLAHPTDITNATAILGSHDHLDHIDRPAWPILATASPRAKFIVPQLLRQRIIDELNLPADRVIGVDVNFPTTIDNVKIAIPAAHEFLNTDKATGLHPCLGFVIEANNFCLYHAGDTCLYEGMHAILRRWRFDLALLPINGRDAVRLSHGCLGNMTYQEAADLAGALRPGLTIPTHFEMFASNSQDPQPFIDYIHVKYPTLQAMIPTHGNRMIVPAQSSK